MGIARRRLAAAAAYSVATLRVLVNHSLRCFYLVKRGTAQIGSHLHKSCHRLPKSTAVGMNGPSVHTGLSFELGRAAAAAEEISGAVAPLVPIICDLHYAVEAPRHAPSVYGRESDLDQDQVRIAMSTISEFFASELRRARDAASMTQEQLGKAINYTGSYVAQIETLRKPPKPDFVKRADDALETGGLLARILEGLLVKEVTPEWLKPYFIIEQAATVLRAYNPLLVYGLLQTEEYARVVLHTEDEERTESKVAARLERQQVLDRDKPPSVVVLLDEAVLRRRVGSHEVMYNQLVHLASVRACVQVLPLDAEISLGLDGPFEIATYDGREVVYVDTPTRGFVLDSSEITSKVKDRWEALRAEALPQRQSKQMILEVAESWTS